MSRSDIEFRPQGKEWFVKIWGPSDRYVKRISAKLHARNFLWYKKRLMNVGRLGGVSRRPNHLRTIDDRLLVTNRLILCEFPSNFLAWLLGVSMRTFVSPSPQLTLAPSPKFALPWNIHFHSHLRFLISPFYFITRLTFARLPHGSLTYVNAPLQKKLGPRLDFFFYCYPRSPPIVPT